MDLIRELSEAKKVSRTTAHAVYHRDYVKTKKKPYRKYDPRAHARGSEDEESSDEVDEDQLTEARGYMREKPRGAPKDRDAEHDMRRQKKLDASPDLPDNWAYKAYNKVTKKNHSEKFESKADAKIFIDQQDNASDWTITGSNTPAVKEGVWDFIKGAGQHVGQQVKQGVQNTVAAGKQASVAGDLNTQLQQLVQFLARYDQLRQQSAPQEQPARPAPLAR